MSTFFEDYSVVEQRPAECSPLCTSMLQKMSMSKSGVSWQRRCRPDSIQHFEAGLDTLVFAVFVIEDDLHGLSGD